MASSGCNANQTALRTSGLGADRLAILISTFTAVCVVILMGVLGALFLALRRRGHAQGGPLLVDVAPRPTATRIVSVAVGLTAVTIVALTALSYFAGKGIAAIGGDDALTIRITGHQWWWRVRYDDPVPSRVFETADEVHVPVGRPVRIELVADDVIHSFWVPSLAGKMDLIPGRHNVMTLAAERPGVYRGQCAEFCGRQHAHMGILVIADPPDRFDAWRDAQIRPAAAEGGVNALGREVFQTKGCQLCHAVRGTPADSKVGPDLTHYGSQRSIAADTLPLTHANLVAWISDPQAIKPGVYMPKLDLTAAERDAVASYLEGLK